jgi:transcriptional regulator with XRE-family HTH domain
MRRAKDGNALKSARAGSRDAKAQKRTKISLSVGDRLRAMRERHNLTINGLGRLAGVPPSTISKIENGLLKPSLVNAIALASALNENLGFLVDRYRDKPQPVSVVRLRERKVLQLPEMGLSLQDMNGNFTRGVLEARYGLLKPGAHSGKEPMRHSGDEICCVIKGALRYEIGSERWELRQNDLIHFKCDMPHRWMNASRGSTEVLWVFSDRASISF